MLTSKINRSHTMLYPKKLIFASAIVCFFIAGCGLKTSERKEDSKYEEGETFSERDQMQKAMEQEFMMTVDPALGYVPKERLITALNYERELQKRMRGQAITWQERGPTNFAGRTRAFIIDSRDNTGNTVFSASVSGGIWKATSFKSTPSWTPVSENMGSLAVCALAQDPSNGNTMYAGTGEGWFNLDAVRGNGIWKTIDGGTTWSQLPSTDSTANTSSHNFDYVQDVVVNSGGIVFASARPSRYCNRGGVFRSSDGGTTWTRVIGHFITGATTCDSAYDYYGADLEVAANGDLFATTGYINSGASDVANLGRIWKSTAANAGALGTWTDITPSGTWQRIELAIAPSNPQVIYALLQGTGDGIGAIKKSINGGTSWTDLPLPTWCNQGSNSSDFTNGQAFYDLIAQVDPTNENNVIIGGIDLFKSTNGGTSWNQITQWAQNCTTLPVMHPDQHNVQFFPASGTDLIATNDGGIYYSNNGGTSWATTTQPNLNGANQTTISTKNLGYNITQLYACDIHPSTTNYFLVGAQDNGSLKLTSSGIGTAVEASLGGDGGFCHIDQTDGNVQVLSYVYNNYYYSRNGGGSFTRVSFNNNGFFINPSDYDDVKKVLYSGAGTGQLGLVTNLASGTPNFSAQTITGLGIRKVSAVKVDPTVSAGGTIWIGGYDSSGALQPAIYKLSNANTVTPTTLVSKTLTAAPLGAYISSIDVDPGDGNHILVTLSNYGIASVYESTDGGTNFASLDNNSGIAPNLPDVPIRWGMFLPASASVNGTVGGGILLATEVGVLFAQTTAGTSTVWTPVNSGLPNVRCDMIRYRRSDGLLAVATHGRGLYTSNVTLLSTGVPTVPNTKNFIDYVAATRQQVVVKIGNLNTTTMETRMFDAEGKLVYVSRTNYSDQSIPIAGLPAGSYIIKIFGNRNEQYTKQFIK